MACPHTTNRSLSRLGYWKVALAIVLCVLSSAVSAQSPFGAAPIQPEKSGALPEDTHFLQHDMFQLLLEEQKLQVSYDIRSILQEPQKSILVAMDDTELSLLQLLRNTIINNFVEEGGVLLLAAEPTRARQVTNIGTFMRDFVTSTSPTERYKNFDDCLRVNLSSDMNGYFPTAKQLITNRAVWFVPDASLLNWEIIASYSKNTRPLLSQQQALVAIGRSKSGKGGMVIAIADSSLLSNGMLWHGDNARFALHLSELLKRGVAGQPRERFLFFRNGQPQGAATERLANKMREEQKRLQDNLPKTPPKPTLNDMLQLGNAIAQDVIKYNVLNEALAQQPRNESSRRYFNFLLLVLASAIVLFALWKLISNRPLRERWLMRRRMRLAYEIQSGNEAGDYRTAAGYLAREYCIQWTGSHQSRDWQRSLALLLQRVPHMPPVDKHQLARIVDIASRGCHERMLAADFQSFGELVGALRRYIAVQAPMASTAASSGNVPPLVQPTATSGSPPVVRT